ncbi:MAG: alpha/beta fold hydrolase [Desulfobulbaceae bacterium]|nr:alpha/beta fold hydrolase [Desulfobulbaceae bacterium]
MKTKAPVLNVWLAMAMATVMASALVLCHAFVQEYRYIQCQVLVEHETVFALYTDTGAGFNENQVDYIRLPPSSLWQSVKFKINKKIFNRLRMDFDAPDGRVAFRQCVVNDWLGFDVVPSQSFSMVPRNHARIETGKDNIIRASATGADPQLAIRLAWFTLIVKNIQIGFWLVSIVLLYPVVTLFLYLLTRFSRMQRVQGWRPVSGRLHCTLLTGSVLCWLLAGLAYWSAQLRYQPVPAPAAEAPLPAPASFQAQFVALNRADGLEIAARLYQDHSQPPFKGNILLLHGNYPQGQSFPLYPLLAESLAERGYRVLTIDFAGFGQSADPFAVETAVRTDLTSETEAALSYLKTLPGGGQRLSIIAHSMGANPALDVGLRDAGVASIILIGPPRRAGDRFLDAVDLTFFWNWALGIGKGHYNRKEFPSWYTQKLWQEYFLDHDMLHALPALDSWSHKPVYFMDGGVEPGVDLAFLRRYVQKVSAPCEYVTVYGADHNLNYRFLQTPPTYEPRMIQTAVEVLDRWCNHEVKPEVRFWYSFQNFLRLLFPFR